MLCDTPCTLQGETGLAVATLERLGDDIEADLRQLMLGTIRRSLRLQIAEEMNKRGYMRSDEWKMLETITLIEV
jgi:spatacsin